MTLSSARSSRRKRDADHLSPPVDRAFYALSDPTRLKIVDAVLSGVPQRRALARLRLRRSACTRERFWRIQSPSAATCSDTSRPIVVGVGSTVHESVALERLQRLGEHLLADAADALAELAEAVGAFT
jgi:hypothetical protein